MFSSSGQKSPNSSRGSDVGEGCPAEAYFCSSVSAIRPVYIRTWFQSMQGLDLASSYPGMFGYGSESEHRFPTTWLAAIDTPGAAPTQCACIRNPEISLPSTVLPRAGAGRSAPGPR